jgi:hypothetical protein
MALKSVVPPPTQVLLDLVEAMSRKQLAIVIDLATWVRRLATRLILALARSRGGHKRLSHVSFTQQRGLRQPSSLATR